jgi:hypothetical protein
VVRPPQAATLSLELTLIVRLLFVNKPLICIQKSPQSQRVGRHSSFFISILCKS